MQQSMKDGLCMLPPALRKAVCLAGRKKRRTPASKDVLSSQDILGANGLATDALGAETDSAEEDNAEHQPSTANALIQYTPPQEADFSKQFLQMLARDAPTAGGLL